MLDTQSSIHLVSNSALLTDITDSTSPVTVQGITGDKVKVTLEGYIKDIGVTAYFGLHMAANILSYHKLQGTHVINYDEHVDTFSATPHMVGPILTFQCVKGHYILDLEEITQVFYSGVSLKSAKYSKRQLVAARKAYDFIIRMGFISYKAAAEIVRRGSINNLGFTRADLVNAQDIYGPPAAYQLAQGTQKATSPQEDDPIPLHESVEQELQVDLFFFLGQVFFISISVLLGLIMVSHLGPGNGTGRPDRLDERSKAQAGKSLFLHISQYNAKIFRIKRVRSDGEPAIKATKQDFEALGVELNVLGHGSHTPHAEAAICHVKNKARSTLHSLPFPLPSKLAAALITFVVHTANMVPKVNAIGHLPAHTAFLGRVPNFAKDAPYAFGTAGFLQRASTATSNSASPRGDYCIWLGTTHNLAGTHRCFNIDTLREITGDTFRPTLLTAAAITRLTQLTNNSPRSENYTVEQAEALILNPSAPFPLDPNRGVETASLAPTEENLLAEIVSADVVSNLAPNVPEETIILQETTDNQLIDDNHTREVEQAEELVAVRNSINKGYQVGPPPDTQIFAALTIKASRALYGDALTDAACAEELQNCITKGVWECLDPKYNPKGAIPSKMFLTPKKLPNGEIDKIKGRVVAGGHRQDRSLFNDNEISSPTVALTSVLAMASLAARDSHYVMTLDHKAAYLNATMEGPMVEMMLTPEIAGILCGIGPVYRKFLRPDIKITVRLKKVLYGCIQSAVLWYNELASTLERIGFTKNQYDICSFDRVRGNTTDRILVYVDDLFITSRDEQVLKYIADALKTSYGGVTVRTGLEHDFLGIHWDLRTPGQVSLSMDGYVTDVLTKYKVTKTSMTPATDSLFKSDPLSPKLSKEKQEQFHSVIMTLHYLAKRTRGDILTAVSFCATRVLNPTQEDERKVDRILSYLLYTRHQAMVLRIGDKLEVRAYVDASFGMYEDGKSITGVAIMLGNATIYVKSGKQKIVTRSSTESELVGISDALSQILWTREFLLAAGLKLGPAIVFQDNQSTIFLGNKGRSTSERSRHIKIRYFFVHHYITSKEVELKYLPTSEMVADILTKPLHGALFQKFRGQLTGSPITPHTDNSRYSHLF